MNQHTIVNVVALSRFIREFAARSISPSLQAIHLDHFTISGVKASPQITTALNVLDLSLKLIDRAIEEYDVMSEENLQSHETCKTSSILEAVALNLQAIGLISEQWIRISRTVSGEGGGELIFAASHESRFLSTFQLPSPLEGSPSALFFSSTGPFCWSSPSCLFRLIVALLQRLRYHWRIHEENFYPLPQVEEGCSALLSFVVRPDRENLGRRRRDPFGMK